MRPRTGFKGRKKSQKRIKGRPESGIFGGGGIDGLPDAACVATKSGADLGEKEGIGRPGRTRRLKGYLQEPRRSRRPSTPLNSPDQMDNSTQYPPLQRQLFPSSTLPPPSQLHLNTFPRNNTLPPISQLPAASRYPPPTYTHPSLSSTASPLSGQTLSGPSTLPWSNQRSSSSRDDLPPTRRLSESRPERDMARDSSQDHHVSSSHVKHEPEDSMPSTSDFVKKLYKCVHKASLFDCPSPNHGAPLPPPKECLRTRHSPTSSRGVLMATASSSRT